MQVCSIIKMPALKAFGVKLTISGDDIVFPYAVSIILKLCWLACITGTLVDYDKEYTCHDDKLLKVYLLIQMSVKFIMMLMEAAAMIVSARGTIADPFPRRHLKWILCAQAGWFLIEFIWDIIGIQWVFNPIIDCSSSHHVLILAQLFSIWNLCTSIIALLYFFIRFGVLRILCEKPHENPEYELLPSPSTNYCGRRLSSLSDESLFIHRRQRSWQWKLKNVFFYLKLRDRQKTIFAAVSATLADAFTKFHGYVPTDILAGMALVKMEQSNERKEMNYYPAAPETRKPVRFHQKGLPTHYKNAVRYMMFSMGAYGWPFLVYSKHLVGLCTLIWKTMNYFIKKRVLLDTKLVRTILGDNWLHWNLYSVLKWTGINETDIVYANFQSEIFCPSFYVALNHSEESVVVALRGTLSIEDSLTDLSALPSLMMTKEGVRFYVHEGMLNTANAVHLKLEGDGILQRIFQIHPTYKLIITGHSLGAGAASLLAILLQPVYPNLHCFAFSPPGGLLNLPAVHHTRPFITSFVVGNDLVPRLSLQNFEKLSDRILDQMTNSSHPKYRIFLNSFMYWLRQYLPNSLKSNNDNISDELLTKTAGTIAWKQRYKKQDIDKGGGAYVQSMPHLLSDEELFLEDDYEQRVFGKKPFIVMNPAARKSSLNPPERPALYLPGRIMHLTRGDLLPTCCGLRWYRPVKIEWASQSEFDEIMLDQDMVNDHLPNVVYKTMMDLAEQERLV